MADEEKISISQMSQGTVDFSSWFEEARNGESLKVRSSQIGDYVITQQTFQELNYDITGSYTVASRIMAGGIISDGEVTAIKHWSSNKTRSEIDKVLTHLTQTGSISEFDTTMQLPFTACEISNTVVQTGTGTPSPTNIRPFEGEHSGLTLVHNGSNQWDEVSYIGYFNVITGEDIAVEPDTDAVRRSNYIRVAPNTTYNFVSDDLSTAITVMFMESDKTPIDMTNEQGNYGHTGYCLQIASTLYDSIVTTPSNCRYIRFYTNPKNVGYWTPKKISINLPATDTEYHLHSTNTYTLTFDSQRGDFVGSPLTGSWKEKRALVYLNDESKWFEDSNSTYGCDFYYLSDMDFKKKTYSDGVTGLDCSCFNVAVSGNNTAHWYVSNGLSSSIFCVKTNSLSLADIKQMASENKIAIMCDLNDMSYNDFATTPITVVSKEGHNVLFTEATEISVSYLSTPQEYTDALINLVNSRIDAITPTVLTGVLTAGETTITFNSSAITTNSTIDPYVDTAFTGVSPVALTVSNGSCTLTFPVQSSNMPVKVEVH